MTEQITVAEAIGRTLATTGATHAFGVVGSGNFHMTNALINAGVTFTASRNEMGAALMADAHGRLTGTAAIVSVHQGGGYLNALTGVLEAVKAHTPMLVLSGGVARGDTVSNFHLDQARVAEGVGAVPWAISTARSAVGDVAAAYHATITRRVPVVLTVPVDLQEEMVDWAADLVPPHPPIVPAGADATAIAGLVDLLANAQRPVIVGGRGAHAAKGELRALGAASGALLVASGGGRGIFVGDEWALDVMGGFATDGAAELIGDADLLVVFGTALTKWTARGGTLTDGRRIVQVDDRPEAIGLHRPVELAIVGDAALVARAATEELRRRHPDGRTAYRTPDVHERVQRFRYWSDQPVASRATATHVDPAELSVHLDRLLPLERVVVPDGGNVNAYAGAFFRVPDENGYVLDLASQSIGCGLAEGIGAAIARPDRLPLVATGDGSLLMNAVELETAARLGLGLLVLVYDDAAYGAEVHIFHDSDQKETVVFPDVDIAAIARGYGCEAITVRALADLAPLDVWLDGPRDRPFVIDAKIEGFASPLMIQDMH
ncbi:thiamine pyrophosphate-binding protein [Microbacterium rhizophilus]|uniref:thiamine pyrophosphate-binding protein n=1 Tax=Microbacterium rhizophilus TaxID=3138934 RepID=UPI0031F161D1